MKKSFVRDLLAEVCYFALLLEAFDQEMRGIQFAIVLKTLLNLRSSVTCILPQVLS